MRQQFILGETNRTRVAFLIGDAPSGTRVELKAPRRTLPQNDKLWAMLTDVSDQLVWKGRRLSTEQWKRLFMDALNRDADIIEGIDGKPTNLGKSTSDLTKQEFALLLESIFAFGAQHGVVWGWR
jgi:hypothetical protein